MHGIKMKFLRSILDHLVFISPSRGFLDELIPLSSNLMGIIN